MPGGLFSLLRSEEMRTHRKRRAQLTLCKHGAVCTDRSYILYILVGTRNFTVAITLVVLMLFSSPTSPRSCRDGPLRDEILLRGELLWVCLPFSAGANPRSLHAGRFAHCGL